LCRARKTKKQSAKATLAEVIKEMAKPRVARSAREQSSVCSERSSIDLCINNAIIGVQEQSTYAQTEG
jgi:hypothetical protein